MAMPATYSSVMAVSLQPIARVRVRNGDPEEDDRREDEDQIEHGSSSLRIQLKLKPTSVRKKWFPCETAVLPIE